MMRMRVCSLTSPRRLSNKMWNYPFITTFTALVFTVFPTFQLLRVKNWPLMHPTLITSWCKPSCSLTDVKLRYSRWVGSFNIALVYSQQHTSKEFIVTCCNGCAGILQTSWVFLCGENKTERERERSCTRGRGDVRKGSLHRAALHTINHFTVPCRISSFQNKQRITTNIIYAASGPVLHHARGNSLPHK